MSVDRCMNTVLTIGYEGLTIEDFIATVKSFGVQVLIDIRDVPVSRKRGFSKKALAAALESVEVDYVHLRALGDPKPGRQAARRGDMQSFGKIFRAHLESREAQEALDCALKMTSDSRTCLLCFERDYSSCHRAIVAQEMVSRGGCRVRHIDIDMQRALPR